MFWIILLLLLSFTVDSKQQQIINVDLLLSINESETSESFMFQQSHKEGILFQIDWPKYSSSDLNKSIIIANQKNESILYQLTSFYDKKIHQYRTNSSLLNIWTTTKTENTKLFIIDSPDLLYVAFTCSKVGKPNNRFDTIYKILISIVPTVGLIIVIVLMMLFIIKCFTFLGIFPRNTRPPTIIQ